MENTLIDMIVCFIDTLTVALSLSLYMNCSTESERGRNRQADRATDRQTDPQYALYTTSYQHVSVSWHALTAL